MLGGCPPGVGALPESPPGAGMLTHLTDRCEMLVGSPLRGLHPQTPGARDGDSEVVLAPPTLTAGKTHRAPNTFSALARGGASSTLVTRFCVGVVFGLFFLKCS